MQFDFNVGPNQSQHIDVAGTFVKYKGGSGMIRVRLNGGGFIDLLPGQGVNNVNFVSVDVQDRTGAQNVGTILAGMYDFRDDRISGTVDVVDGGKSKTFANVAFFTSVSQPANAGGNSFIQLWNPTTDKNIILRAYGFQVDAATNIVVRDSAAQIATIQGSPPSKKLGGPASSMKVCTQVGGGIVGGSYYPGATMLANSTYEKVLQEPLVIGPGHGLCAFTSAVNVGFIMNMEYCEEPIQ